MSYSHDTPARFGGLARLLVVGLAVLGAGCADRDSSRDVGEPDLRLLQAIDLYTGVAGRVDDARAHALLLTVVEETDSPLSLMWLARVHSRGRMGFERDEARAGEIAASVIEDIRGLADLGLDEAVFLMGTAYAEGLGVEPDAEEAVARYRAAADVGHVLAQHNLGNAHATGSGVDVDPSAAVRWWRQAAEQGDAITQLRLGEAYEAGNGVEVDIEEALAWYARSAERGNADAASAVGRLGGGKL